MTLLTLRTGALVQREARTVFWRAWLDWLSQADDAEANAFEAVLASHAHHVRPLHQVLMEVLADPVSGSQVPVRLLSLLQEAGWEPALQSNRPRYAVA